jgi:hypothetical protein
MGIVMDGIAYSWLEKFLGDRDLKGAPHEAARLFAVKVSNLIRKGHTVGDIKFYWTEGSQCRPDRGPYLRAVMKIDGEVNRFWYYQWFPVPLGRPVWQNTTKQYKSYKKHKEEWLGDQR